MAERFGADWIKATLAATAAVTALVPATAHYAASRVPDGAPLATINFYPVGSYSGRLEHFERRWSIDCRASAEVTRQAIAWEVLEAMNMFSSTVGGYKYFGVCEILNTIPPIDAGDVFNTPVQLYLRRR